MNASPRASAVQQALADVHRREWAAVLAATVRVARDLDLAEECVQNAFAAALVSWQRDGVPDRPGAWLTTAARHDALDALRRATTLRSKLHLLVEPAMADGQVADHAPGHPRVDDDRLRLMFLCCHPALATEAQVALTLRLVCGVPTPNIAAAFLVSEPTMAARITRAKKKIVTAGIAFAMPATSELPERLQSVLTTIHLLYTTGHAAPSGPDLTDDEITGRALELARLLRELMPDEREVRGLLALLLANHARRAGRTTADGQLILLEDQDRSTWDQDAIAEAHDLVVGALRGGSPGRFALQAAIAALHATAPTYADTDWPQILDVYDELLRIWPSPIVALNRAVAVAMVRGPGPALTDIEALEDHPRLAGYRYLPAVKADLLRRIGRDLEAAAVYAQALSMTENAAERAFLAARIAAIDRRHPGVPI